MMTNLLLIAQTYTQEQYGQGYAMTIAMILLGVLMIAIPRPRKSSIFEEEKKKKGRRKKSKKKKKK